MVICSQVYKYFGDKVAVKNLSFELQKGEILALLGPNGAGKSTTMKMLTGYLPVSSGEISVCGFDINKNAHEIHKRLGYQPEGTPLYTDATVSEFLYFAAHAHEVPAKLHKKSVAYAISLCGLKSVQHQLIDTLSKGYRQRTCLAQSIIHNPQVLIMDEPTDGLDPNQKQDIQNMICEMGQHKHILLSTHIMEEAEFMADRVLMLNHGQICAHGTIESLREQLTCHSRIYLKIENPANSNIPDIIKKLPEVYKIRNELISSQLIALTIWESPKHKGKLLEKIIQSCHNNHWKIQTIKKMEPCLKDLFQQATQFPKESLS